MLQRKGLHLFRCRADESNPYIFAGLSKGRRFTEKAVARVNAVRLGFLGNAEDRLLLEITLRYSSRSDTVGFLSVTDMKRIPIRFRVNRDRLDAKAFEGPNDPASNFAAISDKNFFEHRS